MDCITKDKKSKYKIFVIGISLLLGMALILIGVNTMISTIDFTPPTVKEIYSQYREVEQLYWLW